jgi:hypothetical protein
MNVRIEDKSLGKDCFERMEVELNHAWALFLKSVGAWK